MVGVAMARAVSARSASMEVEAKHTAADCKAAALLNALMASRKSTVMGEAACCLHPYFLSLIRSGELDYSSSMEGPISLVHKGRCEPGSKVETTEGRTTPHLVSRSWLVERYQDYLQGLRDIQSEEDMPSAAKRAASDLLEDLVRPGKKVHGSWILKAADDADEDDEDEDEEDEGDDDEEGEGELEGEEEDDEDDDGEEDDDDEGAEDDDGDDDEGEDDEDDEEGEGEDEEGEEDDDDEEGDGEDDDEEEGDEEDEEDVEGEGEEELDDEDEDDEEEEEDDEEEPAPKKRKK